ncbi:MAG: RidA family protein [Verrucomicrobia bacterium]|nr:RidA family protein [Verrucomicrobiota bacterium]
MKTVISTTEAPTAVGPYSQGIAAGQFVFCSGQIPLEPDTGTLIEGDIRHQTQRVLKNIAAVLRVQGLGMEDVVKTTVFLTDLTDFGEMNSAYTTFFPHDPPARSTIQVAALPKGANIEIEAIAFKLS